MGATPLLALNVVAYPAERLGLEVLGEILRGGAVAAAAAGVLVAGGHSIDDPEPKYGMTVTGVVAPDAILTKGGGRAGDGLYLSKPVGGGLLTTAAKRGLAPPEALAHAIEVMTTLNGEAARAARAAGARALTDVTGFGLLGHLHELCSASDVAAELDAAAVPAIDGALALAADVRCIAGGSARNARNAESFTRWDPSVAAVRQTLLADAMTSGGLLAALPPEAEPSTACGVRVGRLVAGPAGAVSVR
jgi:selenide,water dikinase